MTWTLERPDRDHISTRSMKAFPPKPFRPVSFDRANQGKPCKSEFPLFRLPIELFHHVTPHISLHDLETLAFIDRDCRQLARSIQFSSVTFSFSDASLGLLDTLLAEISSLHPFHQTSPSASSSLSYTLGPCIRHVTVDLGPPLLDDSRLARFPHITAFGPGSTSIDDSCQRTQLSPQGIYLAALANAFVHAMPNLQSIDWECRVLLSLDMLDALFRSPAHQVNFTHVEWMSGEDDERSRRENLMEVDIVEEMLSSTALTLTRFSWKGRRSSSRNLSQGYLFKKDTPLFPSLRALTLQGVLMADESILDAFLSNRTRVQSLALDCPDRLTASFLKSRGYISREPPTFLFRCFTTSPTRIHRISTSPHHLNFHNLTSLHLVWQSTYLPEESLQIISTISSLRRLWLSAGTQGGWCHDWEIDHDLLLDALEPLQFLETLAFSRDSYRIDNGHRLLDTTRPLSSSSSSSSQSVQNVIGGLLGQAMMVDQAWALQCKLRSAAWERWHRGQMALIVREYAMRFPFLEWCYVGQLPISIERESEEVHTKNGTGYGVTRIVLETAFRTEDVKMLQRRWGFCS
ncbi:hypothetical protein K435DRAFT_859955 [Dendrothele bispora CBS 962.96]|uniref:F-box domain-containing protein n=1 Tax=Dendrothele bispora (strain CBS 962.96) TaxID=1314807 RepID=A0A4V4HFI2_DENBC|nr:hypothetical protein K435DRAFT_859955 [Dendrothele bispora CBS 962.96]